MVIAAEYREYATRIMLNVVPAEPEYLFTLERDLDKTVTFTPSGDRIFFSDVRGDTIGVWSVPRAHTISPETTHGKDEADLVIDLTPAVDVVTSHSQANLTNPVFLEPDVFAILFTYPGEAYECR
jgi:hypothetical protein